MFLFKADKSRGEPMWNTAMKHDICSGRNCLFEHEKKVWKVLHRCVATANKKEKEKSQGSQNVGGVFLFLDDAQGKEIPPLPWSP